MTEIELIEWLRNRLPMADDVLLGPGDDCALLETKNKPILAATTDTLLEGIHFKPSDNAFRVGRKTAAVNLSDLAAMGCKPCWGLTGLGLRRGCDTGWVRDFAQGLIACAKEYSLSLVGGDFTVGDGPTSVTLTALGTPFAGGPVRRSGAKSGDVIAVTGELGGSISGHHLDFTPRLLESEWLCSQKVLNAMMDISDGLSLDLRRLCQESKVGAKVWQEKIPVAPAAFELAQDKNTAYLHALGDGEDFELLCAFSPESWELVQAQWPFEVSISAIGVFTEDEGKIIQLAVDGESSHLPETGFVHG